MVFALWEIDVAWPISGTARRRLMAQPRPRTTRNRLRTGLCY